MRFETSYLTIALSILSLSAALPLDGPQKGHRIVARAKPYSIVNVDGGSTAAPPDPAATTVVEETTKTEVETIKVTHVASTAITTLTDVVVEPTPVFTPSTSSKSSTTATPSTTSCTTSISFSLVSNPGSTPVPPPRSSKKPSQTAEASIVTVVVTAPEAHPTEYYDNGMWHTLYPVKTFEDAVAIPTPTQSTLSAVTLSTTSTPYLSTASLPTLVSSSFRTYNGTNVTSVY